MDLIRSYEREVAALREVFEWVVMQSTIKNSGEYVYGSPTLLTMMAKADAIRREREGDVK